MTKFGHGLPLLFGKRCLSLISSTVALIGGFLNFTPWFLIRLQPNVSSGSGMIPFVPFAVPSSTAALVFTFVGA
jgi:hypothetical protein